MLGERVDANKAADWGLINGVFVADEFDRSIEALAERLGNGPTRSYAAIKGAINAAATNTLDQQLDLERDHQRELGQSEDFKEGVAAFLAKRAPNFTGR